MSLNSDIQLLSKVKIFEGFNHDQLRLMAFGAETRTLGHGIRLYRRDEPSDGGFVIVKGAIELVSGLNETIFSNYGPGTLIGEMALISETNHAATAVAAEDTEVLHITRPLFRRMLEEYPDLAIILQKRIAASMEEFLEQLDHIRIKLDHATDITSPQE